MATTIKVSAELRDRINHDARARGLTAAGLIEVLLDDLDRRRRMESFGAAFRRADAAYREESAAWDVVVDDAVDAR